MARKLEVIITGDARSLERALSTATRSTQSFGRRFTGSVAGWAKGALVFGAVNKGIELGSKLLHAGIGEWQESTRVAAQTAAVLKSTGGVANVTAGQVDQLANALMMKSGVDDEAIKSGENLLLTFTNIRNEAGKGNDVFTRATKTALDMSVALGQDMKSSSIQLGKALNDPVRGVTALQRIGVSFTKAQRDQIKALVDSGHTLKAQKLILAELNKEFGGSAEAAGKTLPGKLNILKQRFNNLLGQGIGKLMPYLERLSGWTLDHWDQISAVIGGVGAALAGMVKVGVSVIRFFWPLIETFAKNVIAMFRLLSDLLHGDFGAAWGELKGIVGRTLSTMLTMATRELGLLADIWGKTGGKVVSAFWDALQSGWRPVEAFFTGLGTKFAGYFTSAASWLVTQGTAVLTGLMTGLNTGWTTVSTFFAGLGTKITTLLTGAASWLVATGTSAMTGLTSGISTGWNAVSTWFASLGGRVQNAVVNASEWLVGKGKDALAGLGNGIQQQWGTISGWLAGTAGRVQNAITGATGWLVGKGEQAMTGMLNGLKAGWQTITGWLSKLGDFMRGLVGGAAGWLVQAGRNVMQGFWNGLKEIWGKVTGWLSSLGGVIGKLKGPPAKDLLLLQPAGEAIMAGLHKGMLRGVKPVLSLAGGTAAAIASTTRPEPELASPGFSGVAAATGAGAAAAGTGGLVVNVHIDKALGLSETGLARALTPELVRELRKFGLRTGGLGAG